MPQPTTTDCHGQGCAASVHTDHRKASSTGYQHTFFNTGIFAVGINETRNESYPSLINFSHFSSTVKIRGPLDQLQQTLR